MAPGGILALTTADRQALIPMSAGYLILMSALGFGLRRLYRPRGAPPGQHPPGQHPPGGWAALARPIAGTVIGGGLLPVGGIFPPPYPPPPPRPPFPPRAPPPPPPPPPP